MRSRSVRKCIPHHPVSNSLVTDRPSSSSLPVFQDLRSDKKLFSERVDYGTLWHCIYFGPSHLDNKLDPGLKTVRSSHMAKARSMLIHLQVPLGDHFRLQKGLWQLAGLDYRLSPNVSLQVCLLPTLVHCHEA
jgi:hypothetical protein